MGGDSSKSYLGKIVPLKLKEVTSNCITLLKVTPLARANEEHFVPTDILPNELIPQTHESIFLNWYVTERILNNSNILELTKPVTDIFTNYSGRIFEVEQNGVKQLLLVGVSNDLDFDLDFTSGPLRSLPFLIYIPPSPQDTLTIIKYVIQNYIQRLKMMTFRCSTKTLRITLTRGTGYIFNYSQICISWRIN